LIKVRPLLVMLALGAICAACQSDPAPQAAAPAATAAPIRQHLVRDIIADPKTFNPVLVTDNASNETIEFLFESLIRLNLVARDGARAGRRSEHDATGTVWIFTPARRQVARWPAVLRDDVRFSFDVVYDASV
jgi:ABC-type oligopeptide transport system substrate-binding subunit